MITNQAGLDLIKYYESFVPTPYLCYSGARANPKFYTIGYGALLGIDNNPVDRSHRPVTETEGEKLLQRDLRRFEHYVAKLVSVPVTISQFSALVSICFNIGPRNFQNSVFRMKLNRKDYQGCADNLWQYRRAAGKILTGLVKRRAAERILFLSDID